MKTLPLLLLALMMLPVFAVTNEAESAAFAFDVRDPVATTAAESQTITLNLRDRGNSGGIGSGTFVLNTLGTAPTDLEIVGPSFVVAGSQTTYQVIWHAGLSNLDVTADARWRFVTATPGNTGMVPPTLYAGETDTPADVQIVASYVGTTGQSMESPPFDITITPHIKTAVAITQAQPGKVSLTATATNTQGTTTIAWDLNGDGIYNDAYGPTATVDYGSWTGTTQVKVQVTDGNGNTHIETRDVTVNKPPVTNQPIVIPAKDPVKGFFVDKDLSPFAFRSDSKNNGLVVITHGLYTDTSDLSKTTNYPTGDKNWEMDMAGRIEARTAAHMPNVALLDWGVFSKNPVDVDYLTKSKVSRFAVWALNQVYKGSGDVVDGTVKTEDFLADLYAVRENGSCMGQVLAGWVFENSTGANAGIDVNRPIHLIGHSAGGCVMGECARCLKNTHNITVDRVTTLDTPFPYPEDLGAGENSYPNPGVAERIVSSNYGVLDMPFQTYPDPWTFYRYKILDSFYGQMSRWATGETGHGYSYIWYNSTIADTYGSEGFANSPILTGIKAVVGPQNLPRFLGNGPVPMDEVMPDFIPGGWHTFGTAAEDAGTWTLTENADAGMWSDMSMPVAAKTLKFEFQFTQPGDGDFLAVNFGDMPVLYRGLDQPLSRDGWVPAEIPMDLIGATDGKLVFTLVSRGEPNARLQIRNIRITQSDDVDADGLTNEQEASLGTDPRDPDTDGDGISDGDEVNFYLTNPLNWDSDGDGQGDAAELAAGTDPMDPQSRFAAEMGPVIPGISASLHWNGVAGRSYRVMRTQALGTLNMDYMETGVPGVNGPMNYVDPNPPPQKAFYWIEVE
jgi:hypothetical protein